MARETARSIYLISLRSAALAGALSLSLLPGAARAQLRTFGTMPQPPQPLIRPFTPLPAASPMLRPMLPGPSIGTLGGFPGGTRVFERSSLSGYGGGLMDGRVEGNPFTSNGLDYNSLFRRSPYELNEANGGLYGPNPLPPQDPSRSQILPGNSPRRQNLASQAPVITPETWRYSKQMQQPMMNNGNSYRRSGQYAPVQPYQYDESHQLHHLAGPGWDIYFPYGAAYYSNYYPDYALGLTAASPYYYYGAFPPYIGADDVSYQPPQYIYVPYPVYTPDGQYSGDRPEDVDNYYLNQNQNQKRDVTPDGKVEQGGQGTYRIGENVSVKDALLDSAISDLDTAWKNGDIQALTKHIRRDARIAVYLRGKYQYSLQAGDYLDMTRDAFRSIKTVSYKLDSVQRKEKDVYTISGSHTYTDQKGKSHTVLVNYVLEKVDDNYYITQVGTSPQVLEQ
jgi:hypothetical protein